MLAILTAPASYCEQAFTAFFVSASLQMSICLAPGVYVSYIMHVVCAD